MYFQEDSRCFRRQSAKTGGERSFVQFILEPLYKIVSHVIGEHPKTIEAMLSEVGVSGPR
jgi:U5 small nuclear ribonucleoprotein component